MRTILLLLMASLSCGLQAAEARRLQVVSLAPNLTRMVVELGARDNLAAVTPFCDAPAGIPRLAGGIQPEPEAVLALAPDLVLATSLTPSTTRERLQSVGLRVEVVETSSLPAIRAAMGRLASLLDLPRREYPVPAAAAKERTAVLLFGADTGYTAGKGTHADGILGEAGLRNVAADAGGPWPQLDDEVLLAADPDFLIVADYAGTSRAEVMAALRSLPVRRGLSAVRGGRVLVFPAEAFTIPGPDALRTPATLRAAVEAMEAGSGS